MKPQGTGIWGADQDHLEWEGGAKRDFAAALAEGAIVVGPDKKVVQ